MAKIRRTFILVLILLAVWLMSPLTARSARAFVAVRPQLVILDLPGLDLQELSTDYPNLERLVSTGSTGLVRVGLTSATHNSGSLIQTAITQVYSKGLVKPIISSKTNRNMAQRTGAAVLINGDDFIDFKDEALKSPHSFTLTPDLKTKIEALLKNYRLYRDQARIILISFGKSRFIRLERNFPQKIRGFYDYLVSCISDETHFGNTLLVIASSHPPEELTFKNSSLTPVVFKGLNFTKGILYTPSTRKDGILTLNDFRAMIRRFLDPKAQTMVSIKNISGEWQTVAYNQHALLKNYVLRWPILTVYCYLLLGVLVLFIGGVVIGRRRLIRILAWSFLLLLTLPAAFLLEALFDPLDWISITFWTILISGSLFFSAYFFSGKDLTKTLLGISFLTVGVVGVDGLLNGYFEHKSFLGYSVVAGARYYGIGNEYMGILLGSYIVGVGLILQHLKKWRREILWATTFFISLILIHPYFGADVGGGITALMGLGMTNYLWLKQPIRFQQITRLGFLTLSVFIFMGILDLYVYQSSMSHLGKLLLSVQRNGIEVFIDLVIRKIMLNLHLISSTPLALILIGVLLAIPFLYRFPPHVIKDFLHKNPEIGSGFAGLSVTALFGLLANDSGIVSAAMTFLFGIGLIFVLIVRKRQND